MADAVGVGEVKHGVAAGGEADSFVERVDEAGAPKAGVEGLVGGSIGDEDDESGEVLVRRAEAVGDP